MKKQTGFTLIEMLVTVAIIGILAAVAVPSYSNYVISGRITDATSELSARRNQMEQFFQDKLSYCPTSIAAGATCPSGSVTTLAACGSPTSYFTFSCSNVTRETYTLSATGTGSMAGYVFTINQAGTKTTTVNNVNKGSCWISKAGGGC